MEFLVEQIQLTVHHVLYINYPISYQITHLPTLVLHAYFRRLILAKIRCNCRDARATLYFL